MRIKSDFTVSPAAHELLLEMGYKHVSRISGYDGWGISIEVPSGVLVCTRPGTVQQASHWDVAA